MPVSDASPIQALDVVLNRLQLAPTPTTRHFTGNDWRRAIAQRRAATLAAALAFRAESAPTGPGSIPTKTSARTRHQVATHGETIVRAGIAGRRAVANRARSHSLTDPLSGSVYAVAESAKAVLSAGCQKRTLVRRARRSRRDERRAKFFSPEIFGPSK